MSATATDAPAGISRQPPGSTLAVVSRRMVALVKRYYGKGPTGARTYHLGDLVVVVLSGGYTPVEKTLLEDGQTEAVMDQRAAFQEAMRPHFTQIIEEEMRRHVVAFMSSTHHDPDVSVELFILEPECSPLPRDGQPSATASPAA